MKAAFNPLQHAADSTRTAAGWAELARLGGDRVALLFQELRKELGRLEGVTEELQYHEGSGRRLPAYRVAGRTLLMVHIQPGAIEASVDLGEDVRARLLDSVRTAARIKAAISDAQDAGAHSPVRIRLNSRRDVKALARVLASSAPIQRA